MFAPPPRGTSRPSAMMRGFTLQESLVSLLIGGTLITGGSSFWSTLQESAKTAAANELVGHLNLARSEAVKRHTRVSMCPSKDQITCVATGGGFTSWQHGWLLYTDDNHNGKPEPQEILRVQQVQTGGLIIRTSAARQQVSYQPTGLAGGSTITFALCDSRGTKSARYVVVSNTGRARVARTSDSNVKC